MTETDKPQIAKNAKRGRPRSEPTTEFGRWFNRFHDEGEVSVDIIQKTLGCSRTYVYELIQGKKTPSLLNAVKLIQMSRDKHLTTIRVEWFLHIDELK